MPRTSGIAATFVELRRELERVVARFVRRADVEDVVQETFVRSYEAELDRTIRHPRAFMLRTAKHLALNHSGRCDQRLVDSVEDFPDPEALWSGGGLEAEFEGRERFLAFCRAVRALPLQCRRAFILKKVYGLSQQEIAAYLGIAESTVEKHVAKGLLDCWTELESLGLVPEARGGRSSHRMSAAGREPGSRSARTKRGG